MNRNKYEICLHVGAEVWNGTPNNIQNVKSTHLLKQQSKNLVLGPVKVNCYRKDLSPNISS